uniref:Cysteine and tyrosine-rich protein 1 n=1 Tax=Hippocampus comes TaxID=109280 RepID=A0A3Q2YW82_HIPCM
MSIAEITVVKLHALYCGGSVINCVHGVLQVAAKPSATAVLSIAAKGPPPFRCSELNYVGDMGTAISGIVFSVVFLLNTMAALLLCVCMYMKNGHGARVGVFSTSCINTVTQGYPGFKSYLYFFFVFSPGPPPPYTCDVEMHPPPFTSIQSGPASYSPCLRYSRCTNK